jgi:tetratricopeptide (TPR) repeat protein
LERLRFAIWRHRRALSAAWVALILLTVASMFGYYFLVPDEADRALAILSRSYLYGRTFRAVRSAEVDFREGRIDQAGEKLRGFLDRHKAIQSTHLETHAVVDAALLLAEVEARQGRLNNAVALLEHLTRVEPLEYRPWLALGQVQAESGDLGPAARSLRQAFLLAPNHPGVADAYLEVLFDLVAMEDALWVEREFEHASRRGLPAVDVRTGSPRSSLRRRILVWAGIPVSQGRYVAVDTFYGLPRGRQQRLAIPDGLLAPCPRGQELYLQLRFENIYEGLSIGALRYRKPSGEEVEKALVPADVAYLHRPGSGKDFYAEIHTGLRPEDVTSLEVVYSCPESRLSEASRRFLGRARLNRQAWRAP